MEQGLVIIIPKTSIFGGRSNIATNILRVYLVPNFKTENMEEEQRKRMKQKFVDAGGCSALNKHAVSDNEVKFCEDCQKWVKTPKCNHCGNTELIPDWTY